MATLDELIGYIFDTKHPALAAEFEGWVRGSRRYKTFAIEHRSKIRTKLRNAHDEGGIQDVRAELQTAAILLYEDRFTLEYEKYAALKQRGPDFTVTFRTHTPFNVEVRRIRAVEVDADDSDARLVKLMAVLCDKVRQMPPSMINVLWLIAEREISETDLNRAVVTLRQLAESKAEDFFTRRGFVNAADFLKHYRQLSSIMLRQSETKHLWQNPLARHKLPSDILNALLRLNTH